MRADLYLSKYGFSSGRSEAKEQILSGRITLDGKLLGKPAEQIVEGVPHQVSVRDDGEVRYASRGGVKLAFALDAFGVSPVGRTVLDIGASGGGFTDCLLRRGASSVYALDCGSGQLAGFLRDDPRVTVMENYNARYLNNSDFPVLPSLVTMDVSFISQTYIFPAVAGLLPEGGELISLVKPQFEVGRSGIGKNGIVKDAKIRETALKRVEEAASVLGWHLCGKAVSPITGGDGNIEYLAWFRFGGAGGE